MSPLLRQFRDFFVSLKLTVVLLVLSIVLIFWATIEQTHLGVWGVQQKFFHTLVVLWTIPGTDVPLPVFPGGYFIGTLLLLNLVAAHIYRFKFEWKKLGIQLTHAGLILLLVGEALTSFMQRESQMQIREGETHSYSEDFRLYELAILDTTDPKFDDVVAIPEAVLDDGADHPIQHPKLPFRVRVLEYYPNAMLQRRDSTAKSPSLATVGIGPNVVLTPLRVTYKPDERNAPAAYVEIAGPEGSLGTWLVSPMLGMPQKFDYQGRTWEITLRAKRYYSPHSITLLKVTHEVYPGTDIPKNFSSRIKVQSADGRDDREVLIYMNNPLRYGGLTYYQYQMDQASALSVFQVVRNPSWQIPYVACIMMGAGLVIQFGLSLLGFIRKRSAQQSTTQEN